jgi:hypothetical protein
MQAHEKILALSSAIHSEASDEMSSKAGPPFENMREYAQKDNEGRVFMKKRERW